MRQYNSQVDEIDFAHELAVISIAAEDFIINNMVDALFADLTAVGSYKGDVFSASMPPDDMNADVDGTNLYNRMLSGNKGFFDILIEYNEGVKDGTINRVDEFLQFYGNGDAKKGLQYIKDDLLNVDMASHFLSETYEWGIVGFGAETIVDILLKYLAAFSTTEEKRERILKNTNANRSFEESEIKKKIEQAEDSTKDVKSITDEMESFIRYLEEGMSK